MVSNLARISTAAVMPDQLVPYVRAVSGLESRVIGNSLLHYGGGQGVLVAYSETNSPEAAVAETLQIPGLENLTVLAPARPKNAPDSAKTAADAYWQIPLPCPPPKAKLANMLRRAQRELEVTQEQEWTQSHAELVDNFRERKAGLDSGAIYLFNQIPAYLAGVRDAVLFAARKKDDGSLEAFALADFTAFETAFYMFAFRSQNAPPGAADLLLSAICAEGEKRGQQRLNLGLGINAGVEFFKRKWGASEFLPYTETSWKIIKQPARRGLLSRLFGRSGA